MLKLNCLIKDTAAVDDIKNAIRIIAGERLENGKTATFPQIYATLRGEGLEIDAESAGSLYNELYGQYKDAAISTPDEVAEFAGKDIEETQKRIVDKINSEYQPSGEAQIGKLAPEKNLANNIAKLFEQSNYEQDSRELSVMKQMETLISKSIRSLLPSKESNKITSVNSALATFFDSEAKGFETLSGSINNLKTLFDSFKDEVDFYKNEITDKLSDEDAEIFNQQWDKYTESIINSAYDIMLGKSEQNKLLNEALKRVKIDGVNIVDNNGNIKWNTLIEYNNSETISDNVAKLFEEGFIDEAGNEQNFTREQSKRIGDYFKRLYDAKLTSVIQRKLSNDRVSNASAKNIISDFVKEEGFLNLVKDKEGKLLLTTANWKDLLNSIKDEVGNVDTGLDKINEKLRAYLSKQKFPSGENKFDEAKINSIIQQFNDSVYAKMVPGTATPNAIERLIALNNVNGGKSFEVSKQSTLNKVVGVSDLSQNTLNQIRDLVNASNKIISGQNVSGETIDNINTNKGAYAFQSLAQIDRKIKEILRANSLDKSQTQRVVKAISDSMGAMNATLLLNPGNFLENIITGFATNVAESVSIGLMNPSLGIDVAKKAQGDFWASFLSHASGGADSAVVNEIDLNPDLPSGERLRYREWFNDIKSGNPKRMKSAFFKTPVAAVNILYRLLYNSFDSGFNSALIRKKVAASVYNSLKEMGYTGNQAATMMMDAVNISPEVQKDIDRQNEEITKIMRSVYLNPTPSDIEQNKRDMQMALYENALQSANNKVTPKQITDITKSLVEAGATQAKSLSGKKQLKSNDLITLAIYGAANGILYPQRQLSEKMRKNEEEGELKKAAFDQLYESSYKNIIGKFVGGVANFLALGVSSTPYGFVMARSLRSQAKELAQQKYGSDVFKAEPGDIRKYAEFHGLARSMAVRASIGTFAMAAYIISKMASDDEDDGVIQNLMQTKSGRRLASKFLPMATAATAYALTDIDDQKLDQWYERTLEFLGNVTNRNYDEFGSFRSSLQRAKNSQDVSEATAKVLGNYIPTININQDEQFTKFFTTMQSAFDKEKINSVKDQEEISKQAYQSAESWMDALLINGSIDKIKRVSNPSEKANRYSPDY